MSVIEAHQLRKTYGDTTAVDDVSLTLEEGQILAVLGPNGAGKTTTVEMIAGLRQADAGTVRVLGQDPQAHPASIREHVGMQLQAAHLPARITVAEAVDLYGSFYADPRDTTELLSQLGLGDKAGTAFKELSGGQQQRLSIALALVGRPRIAILDELTTGLDPHARREVWGLIESVRDSGVSILLVTHFMDEAERLADQVVIIDEGRVVASGSPTELTAALAEGYQFQMRFAEELPAELVQKLRDLAEVDELTTTGDRYQVTGQREVLPAVVSALSSAGAIPTELSTINHNLEDVFVHTTTSREEIRS
ncbi:ABC transporter ATP-binding protein [Ruania zhangjianzhongii]|uniref:ABC transporter ATP-binding protein n=1 Tax=Ruania zhangjianzhongii TaxID=2603206 RepID=UPI0011CB340B|nr:ABC transporter ATP-binding protein [Ruania zhangjianzhongii]